MKTHPFIGIIATGIFLLLFSAESTSKEAAELFPEIRGWELNMGEKVYTPDNLWDIINGAADGYLSYDFQRLYTARYQDEQERQIRVYIFEHSTPKNTFGVFSQERNRDYELNETGAAGFSTGQAYYFITGPYYVQISTNNEGLNEWLERVAGALNQKLNQSEKLPAELELLPEAGKITGSEKYIANNFLGYKFLHSAFVADYKKQKESFQVFIISPENQQETEKLLTEYLDFAEFPENKREQNPLPLEDPYNGPILLWKSGKYICGIMGASEQTTETYLGLLKDRFQ